MRSVFLTLALIQGFGATAFAQNIIQERVSQLKRLTPLQRLTFGPDDNYQPVALNANEVLVTQKTHMNPELQILDLKTRERRPWSSGLRDTDQAQVSPSGDEVVFRSLDQSPDGNICIRGLRSAAPQCLNLEAGEKSSPFWVSEREIGYLRKIRGSGKTQLEIHNLDSQQSRALPLEGIFHPSLQGKRLAWMDKLNRRGPQQRIQFADFSGGKLGNVCSLDLTWPGLSAYPRFSPDQQSLIFSHYLSDTNRDGRIDGDDNSILARVKIDANSCPSGKVTPEPLTSLAENCSQPSTLGKSLLVSCAFEGSLDIYQLPESGVIPPSWTKEDLIQAHASARSPEDRILFLLGLYAREASQQGALQSGLFSQHLLMDDEAGALAWFPSIQEAIPTADRSIWTAVLQAGRERQSEPVGELSLPLRQSLEEKLSSIRGSSFLARSAKARILRLMGGPRNLKRAKAELEAAAKMRPLNISPLDFLLFSREWDLLSIDTPMNETLYVQSVNNTKSLHADSQLIYWSKSLSRLPAQDAKTLNLIESWRTWPQLPPQVQGLLELEVLARQVSTGQKEAYLNYDRVLSAKRDQTLLVRLAAYRAIRLWTQADRLQEVEFITSNLLKFLPPQTLEWTYGRDYFIATAFDRAYELVNEQKTAAALGHFYGAVTLTDDLEAHWGYLTNMVAAGRTGQINRQIDELKKRRFLDQKEDLVRLYAELAERKGALPENPSRWLEKTKKAESHPEAFNDFLRGSVRLQWVMSSSMKEDERRSELEKARQELILALDGARDNDRLRAQILTNLGVLGDQAKLWGPAQKWWQERLELPFAHPEERQFAIYLRAKALVGLQDFQGASRQLESLQNPPALLIAPVRHLKVEAAAYAGEHQKVVDLSESVKNPMQSRNDLKQALLEGRSRQILGQKDKACGIFADLDGKLKALPPEKLKDPPSGANPMRWRILNAGFWARCGSLDALNLQRELLKISKDDRKLLAFEELNFLELRMKNQMRLWLQQGDLTAESIASFMEDLEAHRTAAGEFVNLSQFEALYGLGSLALVSKTKPSADQLAVLKGRMDSFINSAARTITRSDLLISQRLRLDALKMKLEGRPNQELEQALLRSKDLQELESRNQFLAQKTKESILTKTSN